MKMLAVIALTLTAIGCAQARAVQDLPEKNKLSSEDYPVLERWTGEESSCVIKASQIENLADVSSWIEESQKADMQTAFLFVPVDPPKTYQAFLDRGQKKILLLKAGDSLERRSNASNEKLVSLIDVICDGN